MLMMIRDMSFVVRAVRLLAAAACWVWGAASPASGAGEIQFQARDRIALVGNAVADRMQHHNGLETLLARRYADLDLVFRNLAAAGDEVVTRSR